MSEESAINKKTTTMVPDDDPGPGNHSGSDDVGVVISGSSSSRDDEAEHNEGNNENIAEKYGHDEQEVVCAKSEDGSNQQQPGEQPEPKQQEHLKQKQNQEEHYEEACPICLHHPSERRFDQDEDCDVGGDTSFDFLVSGPCGHALCVECMEHLLNVDAKIEQQWPPQSAGDIHLSAPTLGRCPICRSVLSLFDICRKVPSADVPTRTSSNVEDGDKKIPTSSPLYPKVVDCWNVDFDPGQSKNPLVGSVYIPYRGRPGQLSFHWDWQKLKRHSEEPEMTQRPFLNLTRSIEARPDHWRLEDGRFAPKIAFFEENCHFHERSRTFHGTILWPKRLNGSYEWDVILGFSKDYRFLSSGRVHMKRERNLYELKPGNEHDHSILQKRLEGMTTEQIDLCRYPMDGRWTVSWSDNLGHPHQKEIHVVSSEYRQSGWAFYLSFDDPRHPMIQWPRSRHRQWVEEGIDLIRYPMGPPPGHKIKWRTSDPKFPVLFWTRQTVGPVPLPKVILFGMGQDKHLYQRLHAKTDRSIPQYCGNSVFGNVFTKRLYIGSASYHFLSPTNSFISYRHPACRDLPTLDDGSPLPTRVDFHNIDWDPEERKLTANIEWEKDFGTSWNDNVRWTLTMHFDTQYMVILKGGIQCEWCKERRARPRPARPPPTRPPPVPVYVPPPVDEEKEDEEGKTEPQRNEEWIMSGYGYDQVYVNAACIERYRRNNQSTKQPTEDIQSNDQEHQEEVHSEEEKREVSEGSQDVGSEDGGNYASQVEQNDDGDGENDDVDSENELDDVDFHELAEQHANRLKDEGATERTISFLTYLFNLVAEDRHANPIDFLVD